MEFADSCTTLMAPMSALAFGSSRPQPTKPAAFGILRSVADADPMHMTSEALAAVLIDVVGIASTIVLACWHARRNHQGSAAATTA